jgi:hypothetical protein
MTDRTDHDHLERLITALGASPRALKRPVCRGWAGDWQITGKLGHVLADGTGFVLYVATGESVRRSGFLKKRLAGFCRVTQDGDDEGALHLDRLPTEAEAEAELIREALGIKRKRHLSAETIASITDRLLRSRTGSPSNGPSIARLPPRSTHPWPPGRALLGPWPATFQVDHLIDLASPAGVPACARNRR